MLVPGPVRLLRRVIVAAANDEGEGRQHAGQCSTRTKIY
jgi:hypothetical protein